MPPEAIESLLCCWEKSWPLKKSVILFIWYWPKSPISKKIKKIIIRSIKINDADLIFILETKNIKNIVDPINIAVPRSGCMKINESTVNETVSEIKMLCFSEIDFAKNRTIAILINSDGWKKNGMPKFDKSNHLLTPKIGVVNLNPTNRSNETTNKGLINL